MTLESVDYTNTFITIAPDASGAVATPQPRGGKPTVASATWTLIHDAPYEHNSGDVIFTVWAERQGIDDASRASARTEFYSAGRPCLRASDLGKRYGWGVHADADGKVAVYPVGSDEYETLSRGTAPDGTPVKVIAAMRSSRK